MSGLNRKFRKNSKPDQILQKKSDGDVMAYRVKDKKIIDIIKKFILGLEGHEGHKSDYKEIVDTGYITADNASFLTLFLGESISRYSHLQDLGEVEEDMYNKLTKYGIPIDIDIGEIDLSDIKTDKVQGFRLFKDNRAPEEIITLHNYLSEYFKVSKTHYGHICLDIKGQHIYQYHNNLEEAE